MPLVSPMLVERERELATLRSRYDAALAGSLQIVTLAGEAGVGKSRLLQQVIAWNAERGATSVVAQCFESDRARPFGAIRDLAHGLQSHAPSGTGASDWHRHLATLATIAPELAPPAGNRPDTATDWRQIAHAVSRMVTHLAGPPPVVVAFEDIHWSDEASLICILHLTHALRELPVLFLLTYRHEDASPPLTHLLAALDRGRMATELDLPALREAGTATMVRAIFDLERAPRPDFTRSLHTLTGGNPFFVEEVLASLVATGSIYRVGDTWERKRLDQLPVPRSVADAVQTRLTDLSPAAHDLLVLTAVAGQRLDISMLGELAALPETDLVPLLRELVEAQVLIEDTGDRVAFRHALTRHAVERKLLGRERVALHRRVFETLERLAEGQPESWLDERSHQAFAAEAWEAALRLGVKTGTRALALGAPHAALTHLDQAIAAARELHVDPPLVAWRARGQANETTGNFDAALADYTAALARSEATGNAEPAWQAHLDLCLLWSSRDYAAARRHVNEALRLAREMGNPAALAGSLNRMGNWLANSDQPDAALDHHHEALAIYRQLGDRHGEADTLDLMAMVSLLRGDLPGFTTLGHRASGIYREVGDRTGELRTGVPPLSNAIPEGESYVGRGDVHDAIDWISRLLEHAREIDSAVDEAGYLDILGQCFIAAGSFGAAIETLDHALELARQIGHGQWTTQTLWILSRLRTEIGQTDQALALLNEAAIHTSRVRSGIWHGFVWGDIALAQVAAGNLDVAASTLASHMAPDLPMVMQGQRALWLARIEWLLATGSLHDARDAIDRMYAATPNLEFEGQIPRLAILKSRAIDDHQAALTLLRSTLDWCQGYGALPQELAVQTALANRYAAAGDRPAADPHVAAAMRLIDLIGASLPDDEARQSWVQTATARLVPGHDTGGLSPRETEVAALVHDGLTNRAIAERLFITERTVESHVASILRKRGFTSRSQIAAWVANPHAHGSPPT